MTALAAPAYFACNQTFAAMTCLVGLGLIVLASRFRGQDYEQGARAGALAGLLPCLVPSAVRAWDPDLCAWMFQNGVWVCGLGGAAAGVILGLRSRASHGVAFWSGALATLGLAAALGCIPAGTIGFVGLASGIVAGGAPVLAARRALA
jgi:hypothetical protein